MYNGITTVRFCPGMRCEGSNDRRLHYYSVQDYITVLMFRGNLLPPSSRLLNYVKVGAV